MLSAELMLHGVSLTLVTFARVHNNLEGQAFVVFIITVATCEAGLALAIILALYQRSKTLDIDFWSELREPELPAPMVPRGIGDGVYRRETPEFPRLTPAGVVPTIRDKSDPDLVDDADSPTADSPLEPPQPEDVIKTAIR